MATGPVDDDIELHRPFIDNVEIACPECGKPMHRVPEVIDCWYDSGSMPFAQWHYPFEKQEIFEERFPADFICEAVDQTRGWFYTLLAISTLLFDCASFDNCLVLGMCRDARWQEDVQAYRQRGRIRGMYWIKHGADAVRWYFYTASAPWLPLALQRQGRQRRPPQIPLHPAKRLRVFRALCQYRQLSIPRTTRSKPWN